MEQDIVNRHKETKLQFEKIKNKTDRGSKMNNLDIKLEKENNDFFREWNYRRMETP